MGYQVITAMSGTLNINKPGVTSWRDGCFLLSERGQGKLWSTDRSCVVSTWHSCSEAHSFQNHIMVLKLVVHTCFFPPSVCILYGVCGLSQCEERTGVLPQVFFFLECWVFKSCDACSSLYCLYLWTQTLSPICFVGLDEMEPAAFCILF